MKTPSSALTVAADGLLPAHIQPALQEYAEAGMAGAVNTQRAYAGDLRRFRDWCTLHDQVALPASVETVAGFLTELAVANKRPATIARHQAAIAKYHELSGMDSPTTDKRLKVVLRGIMKEKGKRQKQAPAFTIDHFKRVVASLDVSQPVGLRNRALLLLGFAGAFRRDELRHLLIEQLEFDEQGLVIELTKSKTNQLGDSEKKSVFYSPDPETCPVRCTQAWLTALAREQGPLFVRIRRHQQLTTEPLSGNFINNLVKSLFGAKFSAHSLRASFVTISKLNGADDLEIMNQTKHKTNAMIQRYSRTGTIRKYNSARKLGL